MRVVESQKDSGRYIFRCPGCKMIHEIPTKSPQYNGAQWGFDGNVNAPTFSPSLFVRSGHYVPGQSHQETCWCTYAKEHPEEKHVPKCVVCHSFIRGGNIQFLGDCSHELAGQTVALPELSEEFINIHTDKNR